MSKQHPDRESGNGNGNGNGNGDEKRLRGNLERQIRRLRRARPAGVLGVLVLGGTAGLLLVVPVVLGAYLGRWLDERASGYSVGWTVNLILIGLGVGIANVILFFRRHGR